MRLNLSTGCFSILLLWNTNNFLSETEGFVRPSSFTINSIVGNHEEMNCDKRNYRALLQRRDTSIKSVENMIVSTADTVPPMLIAQETLWYQTQDFYIFVIGLIPFIWATIEFWRRIAVGEPFGTGKDSIYIGKDNAPEESRGRRTLDKGAFIVAYFLFGAAAITIILTLYSVISSPVPLITPDSTSLSSLQSQ